MHAHTYVPYKFMYISIYVIEKCVLVASGDLRCRKMNCVTMNDELTARQQPHQNFIEGSVSGGLSKNAQLVGNAHQRRSYRQTGQVLCQQRIIATKTEYHCLLSTRFNQELIERTHAQ